MDEKNSQMVESLLLDQDELAHIGLLPDTILSKLVLAKDGAKLTLNIVKEAGTRCQRGSPTFFVLRSLARAANFARLSAIGLQFGYYAGAASQTRMAYESLVYAFLFHLHPDKAFSWLRTTFDMQMNRETRIDEEQRLRGLAKKAFNQWTGEKDLGQEIWEGASNLMHHTVIGLAAEAGLEPWQLLPDDLFKAIEVTEGDFDSAMKLTSLLSRFGDTRGDSHIIQGTQTDLPWRGEFNGLFDQEWLDFWSIVLLYLVHRMTDFSYQIFPPSSKEVKKSYRGWHKAVKSTS